MTCKAETRTRNTVLGMAAAILALAIALMTPQGAWAQDVNVGTIQQWKNLVAEVNAGTNDHAGDIVNVTANLDFNGQTIAPLGTAAHPFKGTLNGGGHTFSQFTINVSGSVDGVGLVGVTQGPVTGVTIGGLSFINISEGASGRVVNNVGMVVGSAGSSVTNCINRYGAVTIKSSVPQKASTFDSSGNVTVAGRNFLVTNVGGVAGQVLGNMSGCSNGGAVSVTQDSTPLTENEQSNLVANVGGVVGCLGTVDSSLTAAPGITSWEVPDGYDMTHGSLSGCSNTGTITVSTTSEAGLDRFGQVAYAQSTNIGGIAGYSRGSMTSCTNTGYLNAPRGTGVGGIVGSLRSLTTSSSYSGNFSSTGQDDGLKSTEPITVSTCTSAGDIVGFVFPGGIAGRAGTYTLITDCLSGLNANGGFADMYIVAERWNKPFPAGIAGSTYGTVSYCANYARVASGYGFDHSKKTLNTRSGYYASGLVGNTSRFTDTSLNPVSPLSEVYGCYNVGQVLANANMRQRALVGDNGGFVHDNVALEGCVSTNDLLYGDDPDETESSGGSSANNMFVTKAQLQGTAFIDEKAGTTAVGVLNTRCDADGWSNYWAKSSSSSLNQGYPVLKRQVTWNPTALTAANTTVALTANAEYTGLASVPSATVSVNGTTLRQNVDFRVVPQTNAVDVTVSTVGTPVAKVPSSQMPYKASIQGIGSYSGTVANAVSYGITKGNLANCTVAVNTKQFNAKAQTLVPADATVKNQAGGTVDPSEYSIALTKGDSSLTDGKAINAKKYGVTLTAQSSSAHFYGTNTSGIFNVKSAQIVAADTGDTSSGNHANPEKVTFTGNVADAVAWYSMTTHNDATDAELRAAGAVFPYTGHAIKPTVTGVTLTGTTVDGSVALVEGADYRVVYGATTVDGGTAPVDNVGQAGKISYGYVMVRYVPGSNYSNYDVMRFIIDGTSTSKLSLSKAVLECPAEIIYESAVGSAGYRPVKVMYAGSELTEGTDYTITYSNNAAIGTASYSITGKGLFEGSLSGTFKIVKGDPLTFTYAYNADGTATVTGVTYNGALDSFALNIPSTTTKDGKTYTVTAVADKAFGNSDYTKVPEDAKKISSVTIPASVESIGSFAFCPVNLGMSALSNIGSVTFAPGSRLKTIGANAFQQAAITSLTIPASVQSIDSRAFRGCTNLESVTFESMSATEPSFHDQAFQGVNGVKATYYDVASSVQKYVTDTIKSQSWTSNVLNTQQDDEPGKQEDVTPLKTAPTEWQRLWGAIGLDTMSSIVDAGDFAEGGVVVLATFNGYWDALTAAGAAGLVDAPVIMTDGSSLSQQASDQLQRLHPSTLLVCGGTAAITDETADAAGNAAGGAAIVRAAGPTAIGTATEIFQKAPGLGGAQWSDTAFICTNEGYWDALAAAPISYAKHMPIFLTAGKDAIDDSVLSIMAEGGISNVYIVGGTAAIADSVATRLQDAGFGIVDRLWGQTAVETSEAVASCGLGLGMIANKMGVATNGGYWDALSGAALCGKNNAVLVLVGDASSNSISGFVQSNSDSIISAEIFGGTAAIDEATEQALKDATTSVPAGDDLVAASW